MKCIVLAGGTPDERHPLYAFTQGRPKAVIDMGGRTMLERVVDACHNATRVVDEVIIVGIEDPAGLGLEFRRPVQALPGQGGIIANIMAGVHWVRRHHPAERAALLCSSDIPHLTGPIIEHFVEACRPFDRPLYYPVVTSEAVERRYPGAGRSYLRFKGGIRIAAGDMVLATEAALGVDLNAAEALANDRKHFWRFARVLGVKDGAVALFKFLTRRLSLEDVEILGGRVLGSDTPAQVVFSPHPELAMDADKPHHIRLLRAAFGDEQEVEQAQPSTDQPAARPIQLQKEHGHERHPT